MLERVRIFGGAALRVVDDSRSTPLSPTWWLGRQCRVLATTTSSTVSGTMRYDTCAIHFGTQARNGHYGHRSIPGCSGGALWCRTSPALQLGTSPCSWYIAHSHVQVHKSCYCSLCLLACSARGHDVFGAPCPACTLTPSGVETTRVPIPLPGDAPSLPPSLARSFSLSLSLSLALSLSLSLSL